MDGKELLYSLRQLLGEDASSGFMDSRTSYRFLWEAAKNFVSRTDCLRTTQSITTVASQAGYSLSADFMSLYLRDRDKNYIIKYNDGSTNTFLRQRDYEAVITEDNTSAVDLPQSFSIIDAPTLSAQVSGTASAVGAASGGQCTLTDTSSSTKFANVEAGDVVHNTTDGSDGFVLSKTDSTHLVIALFGGTDNDITSADAYVIQPQGRLQLVLNPPPSTSSHTVTVYYIQIPAPVFSSYGVYRFQSQWDTAILNYAAWLYKYKDRTPELGDKFHQFYELEVRRAVSLYKSSLSSNDFPVSFRKR